MLIRAYEAWTQFYMHLAADRLEENTYAKDWQWKKRRKLGMKILRPRLPPGSPENIARRKAYLREYNKRRRLNAS